MDNIETLLSVFREIPDPRVEKTKLHSLEILLFIALCASLSGGESFYDMEHFAGTRQDWLRVLGMQSVPGHDTFNRVFQMLSPASFDEVLTSLTSPLREHVDGDVVAIDGKTHRRTGGDKHAALRLLNAWSAENRLVLGQLAVGEKSNEITALPKLIEVLDLKGCVVTTDAMGCQKATAAAIIEKKADYMLALKGNQGALRSEVKLFMDALAGKTEPGFESVEKAHGRMEIRRCWQTEEVDWREEREKWAGLRSFCAVQSLCARNGKQTESWRYFISSLKKDEARAAQSIRDHWTVENSLHWCLDVVFGEDQSRARARNAAKNLGTLRAISLNLPRRLPGKRSLKGRRWQAAMDIQYLVQALRLPAIDSV